VRNDREVDVIQSDCGNPGLKDSGSSIKLGMTSYCGFPVKLRMTKKREEWILDQVKDDKMDVFPHYPSLTFRTLSLSYRTTPFVIPATSMSFPRKRESRIKRFWILNQVGDDKLLDPR
jgi:hypothetical protein